MIIELSPTKKIPGAFTVWNQPGPEVDLVVDLKALTFKEGSVDELYSFHVVDHLFDNEIVPAMKNWKTCLKQGANLFVIVDDFEYLARAFVGGDITIDELNANFAHPTNVSRENILRYFKEAGFNEDAVVQWFNTVTNTKNETILQRQYFEMIYSSKKHE